MSHIHIITNPCRLENTSSKTFTVLSTLSTEQKEKATEVGQMINERTYKLQCGSVVFEVSIPEICNEERADAASYLIVPEFLIPGRPYPIYVYLYAIVLYSSNAKMGQREAAERTRKLFGLTTFSHTTLGRAIRKLERMIKKFEKELQDNEARNGNLENDCLEKNAGSFPSVELIKNRKEIVASYFKKAVTHWDDFIEEVQHPQIPYNYKRPPYKSAFIDECHNIAGYTFSNNQSFLL